MRNLPRIFRFLLLALLALFFVSILASTGSHNPVQKNLGAAAFYAQATDTPPIEGESEIGSTDGIVLMGVIIVLIVMVPILIRRKSWSEE